MYYDLKTSSNEILIWVIDVLLMRKAEYLAFLDYIKSGKEIPKMKFIHEKLWYEHGKKLEDFDNEIIRILNELDKDYRNK